MKKLRIEKSKIEEIVSLFNSTLSLVKISKRCKCDERTVRKIFEKTFGIEETDKRCDKMLRLYHKNCKGEHTKIENKNPETFLEVVHLFNTEFPLKEIGNKFGISPATVANIWKRVFGNEQYKKRVKRMRVIQRKRANSSNFSFIGSKNEIYCYTLLKQNFDAKHHDYSIVPGLEIDISIPNEKLAISWDGVWHRKIIISEISFKNMQKNDKIREEFLSKRGWRYIIIEDNGKHNPQFVEQKVKEIEELIKKDWQGKVII